MADQGPDPIIVETSIVIVGEDCNPSILNPDFLRVQGIVPQDWGWELADAPLTTRNLSTVAYDSQVTLMVEPNRFQVKDGSGSAPDPDSRILHIARRYIEVLPHVRYTGVGNNFQRFFAVEDPVGFLRERFIKPGPWSVAQGRDVGVSFGYDHDAGQFTLSLGNQILVEPRGEQLHQVGGVGIKANFHRDCAGYPSDGQVRAHIDKLPADAQELADRIDAFFTGDPCE
jgi:hypothetical protein